MPTIGRSSTKRPGERGTPRTSSVATSSESASYHVEAAERLLRLEEGAVRDEHLVPVEAHRAGAVRRPKRLAGEDGCALPEAGGEREVLVDDRAAFGRRQCGLGRRVSVDEEQELHGRLADACCG